MIPELRKAGIENAQPKLPALPRFEESLSATLI